MEGSNEIERQVAPLPANKVPAPPIEQKSVVTAAENHDNGGYVTGVRLVIIVSSITLACFLMLLDTMVVSTAIPRITDEFQSLTDVGWYASAYQFGSAAPQPLTGKMYTYFKNKWTFLAFFLIFELGSVLCAAANSSNMLIVGRAVAGFGAAGIMNGSFTIVAACAPLEQRPQLIGIVMGVNQLGLIAGPLIGGAFTSYSTWRWCFWINLPIGAVLLPAICFMQLPEQTQKPKAKTILPRIHHYLDIFGFCLFAPSILMLLLALQFGSSTYSWNSSEVIGLFSGSGITFTVWMLWNYRKKDDALIPYSMIRRTAVWSSSIYQALLMSAVYGATFYLPIYFQAINNASPIMSGIYLLPTILPQLLFAGSSGMIIAKIGYVIPVATFSTILLSIGSGLYSLLGPGSPMREWVGFQVLAGIGSGSGLQTAIIAVQAAVTDDELSSAMAFIVFAQSLGPAIALTLCQLVFYQSLKDLIPREAPEADTGAIVQAGATQFRELVNTEDLPSILVAYSDSINRVFYLVSSLVAVGIFFIWGMGWVDIRKTEISLGDNPDIEKKEKNESLTRCQSPTADGK